MARDESKISLRCSRASGASLETEKISYERLSHNTSITERSKCLKILH